MVWPIWSLLMSHAVFCIDSYYTNGNILCDAILEVMISIDMTSCQKWGKSWWCDYVFSYETLCGSEMQSVLKMKNTGWWLLLNVCDNLIFYVIQWYLKKYDLITKLKYSWVKCVLVMCQCVLNSWQSCVSAIHEAYGLSVSS